MTAQEETIDALDDIESDLGDLLGELDLNTDLDLGDDDNLLFDEDDNEDGKEDK